MIKKTLPMILNVALAVSPTNLLAESNTQSLTKTVRYDDCRGVIDNFSIGFFGLGLLKSKNRRCFLDDGFNSSDYYINSKGENKCLVIVDNDGNILDNKSCPRELYTIIN